jgi:hypothetical protein
MCLCKYAHICSAGVLPNKAVEAIGNIADFPYTTMANAGLGVPIKLLHESLGHIITVELKTGQLYRGKLAEGV